VQELRVRLERSLHVVGESVLRDARRDDHVIESALLQRNVCARLDRGNVIAVEVSGGRGHGGEPVREYH